MFICSNVSLRFSVSSLIFHLNDISIAESRVFKSPTIIVLVSTSPFRSVFAWYIQVLLHCVCVFLIATSSWWIDPFISLYLLFSVVWHCLQLQVPNLVTRVEDYEYKFIWRHIFSEPRKQVLPSWGDVLVVTKYSRQFLHIRRTITLLILAICALD